MPALHPIITPGALVGGFFESGNTDEAATLRALGCDPIAGAACRIDHDKLNPYDSGRGQVVFALSAVSSTWKIPARALSAAFHDRDGTPAVELDDLIAQVQDADLRAKIQKMLPLAIASYGRAFGQQRQQCMALVKASPHHAKGRSRSGGHYSIDVKNREFARRHGCA